MAMVRLYSARCFRVLASLCPRLEETRATRLLDSILAGPPRWDAASDEDCARCRERQMWLRLEKLRQFGCDLPPRAAQALEALRANHPEWQLQPGDRDEFTSWMESRAGEWPPSRPVSRECLEWSEDVWVKKLKSTTERGPLMHCWRLLLGEQFDRAVGVVVELSKGDAWPVDAWEKLLEFAALNTRWQDRCQDLSLMLADAPERVVEVLAPEAARWLHYVSESLPTDVDGGYWSLWERLANRAFATSEPERTDPLDAAWNSPAGHLTEALLNRMALARPRKRDDLSPEMWARLDRLATGVGGSYPTARVLLASRLLLLHTLDASWVETTLIRRFDWDASEEAAAVWQGFLWQPRRSPELWSALKPSFLKAAGHTPELGARAEQFYCLVAAICIDRPGWISDDEAQDILRSVGASGRATVAMQIWRLLEGAGERGEALWTDRVGPWLSRAWPKDRDFVESNTAEYLALAAIASSGAFPSAVATLERMLTPLEQYFSVADALRKSAHPEAFPEATLKLLSLTVPVQSPWAHAELREVLNRAAQAQPALRNSPQYRALEDFLRRHDLP